METPISMDGMSTILPDTTHQPDIVPVFNWDSHKYCGDLDTGDTFLMEVTDRRRSNGQMFVDVSSASGSVVDVMSISLEINRLPGSKTDVQCLHVSFDADNMAFTLFRQGNHYILRPEVGVDLLPTVLPDGSHAFIVD